MNLQRQQIIATATTTTPLGDIPTAKPYYPMQQSLGTAIPETGKVRACQRRELNTFEKPIRSFLLPAAVFAPSLVFHCLNSCVTGASTLFAILTALFSACALFTIILLYLTQTIGFCSILMKRTHQLMDFALVLAMGASLSAYDFYTYNLNIFAALWSLLMWGVTFYLIFMCFFPAHLITCPDHRFESVRGFSPGVVQGKLNWMNRLMAINVFLGFLIITWLTIPAFVLAYDPDLDTMRPNTSCVIYD